MAIKAKRIKPMQTFIGPLTALDSFVQSLTGNEVLINTIKTCQLDLSSSKEDSLRSSVQSFKVKGYDGAKAFCAAAGKYGWMKPYYTQAEILMGIFPAKLRKYTINEIAQSLEQLKPFGQTEPNPKKAKATAQATPKRIVGNDIASNESMLLMQLKNLRV